MNTLESPTEPSGHSIKRKRPYASLTSGLTMLALLPLSDLVYRRTWTLNPAIAESVFFGMWAVAALLCVAGSYRRERLTFVILSVALLPLPLLFSGIAG